ncbi:class I SAM-dependent methyltransferase [bacterium]|nr:class I SAM-dependent methyltransferase [candidate division CSSED10-310 bacterium]
MSELREEIRRHFDAIAPRYDEYKRHSNYYYDQLKKLYKDLAGENPGAVLEIGCGTGDIIAALAPRRGLGIDLSEGMIVLARGKHAGAAHLEFQVGEAERLDIEERFDLIIMPDVVEHLYDVGEAFRSALRHLAPGGRLIVSLANHRWEPVLQLLEKAGHKMPEGPHSWLDDQRLSRLFSKTGILVAEQGYRCLIPARVPMADRINARFHKVPLLRGLGLIRFFVCIPA